MLIVKDIESGDTIKKLENMGFKNNYGVFKKDIYFDQYGFGKYHNMDMNSSIDVSILINTATTRDGRIHIYVNNIEDLNGWNIDDMDCISKADELDILYDLFKNDMIERI